MRTQYLDGVVALQLTREFSAEQAAPKLGATDRYRRKISLHRIARQLLQCRFGAQRALRPIEFRVESAQHSEQGTAQAWRDHPAHTFSKTMPALPPVAAKHFVAAIPRQSDGDILLRHRTQPKGRHRRAVANRLVID